MKKLVFLLFIALACNSEAQEWTGAISQDWNNPSNWTIAPQNGDDIVIDPANYTGNAFQPTILTASNFSPAAVQVLNGGVLTIQNNLSTSDDVDVLDVNSKIILQSGNFNVNSLGNGRLVVDLSATMEINGGTLLVGQRLIAGTGALIEINGGQVTANQRLLMDLGGSIIQNNGTVNVGETMALADGDLVLGDSKYTLNGGTLNVNGELGLENEMGNFNPSVTINGGTLNVAGDLFWLGVAPGEGRPRVIMNGGTSNLSGNISNLVGSTVQMDWKISQNAIVNFSGASLNLIHINDSIVQTGTSILNIAGTNSINNEGGIVSLSGYVNIVGNTTLNGTGFYQFHDFSITPTGNFSHVSPSIMRIHGDFTNNGSFNHASNQLVLNGAVQQIIDGSTTTTFNQLTISNPAGILMNQSFNISNFLDLNVGVIQNPTPFVLTILDNASSSEGNATSFVDGPISKVGNDAFIFPTGDVDDQNTNHWARIKMSAPTNMNSNFSAFYKAIPYSNLTPVNTPLTAVSVNEHWGLTRLASNSQVQVSLYWENANESDILNCNELSVASWNGNSWDNELGTMTGTCGGNNTGMIETINNLDDFNFFTFGNLGEVTSQEITLCSGESTTVGVNTYSTNGVYLDVLTNQFGNDSTVISTINVLNPIVLNQSFTLCFGDSIEINGTFYDVESTVENVYPSAIGCDSTVVSTISILNQITSSSTINLCAGESIVINGQTFNSPTIATETFLSVTGCDSTVNYDIQVYNPVNVNVSQNGLTLTSQNTNASSYQWIDCETNSPIANQTAVNFTFIENGSVKVIVVDANNCSDTSACFSVNDLSVNELYTQNLISISPNPSSSVFNIQGFDQKEIRNIQVFDNSGKLCWKQNISKNDSTSIDLSNLAPGIYQLIISTDKSFPFKIVKE